MKFPTYITQKELEKTHDLYKKIRKIQDFTQAKFFKKIALAAAYGAMYKGKIDYTTFLSHVSNFFVFNSEHTPITHFWNIKQDIEISPNSSDKIFYIKEKIILEGTIKDVEEEIKNVARKYKLEIKPTLEYTEFFTKFKNQI